MTRNPWRRFMRAALIGGSFLIAPLFPEGASLGLLALAVLIAYDGTNGQTTRYVSLFVVAVELLFGLDIGVLVLPYLIACVLWHGAQRVTPLNPWAQANGWHSVDIARTTASAGLLWSVMMVISVTVEAGIYGHGLFVQRISLAFGATPLWIVVLFGVCILMLLRRIDVPLRERIRFGT